VIRISRASESAGTMPGYFARYSEGGCTCRCVGLAV
jgi:hypothetical protein